MECSLKNKIPSEHNKEGEPRYNIMLNCPLFNGKQICLWCCLHICDIAEPLHRVDNADRHPGYAEHVLPLSLRADWDEVWHTCSTCSKG